MTMESSSYPNISQMPPTISRAPSRAEENIQRLVTRIREVEADCRSIISSGWHCGDASIHECATRLLEAGAHAERVLREQAKHDVKPAFNAMRREAIDG